MPVSPESLNALRRFDTPTICNAIELFKVRPRTAGYMDGRIQACFAEMGPIVGYASTATFCASAAPKQGGSSPYTEAQVEAFASLPGPAIVVFQDLDEPAIAATFGEMMCTTYQAFGAVGLITSGAGRDLEQVRALGFPVFTNGTICSHGYSSTPSIHMPVSVGGITLQPGDLLHADRNGVTTIPLEIADELAEVCAQFLVTETWLVQYLKGGQVSVDGLREVRAAMRAEAAKISARVARK